MLGMFEDNLAEEYADGYLQILKGDRIFAYSDGIVEQRSSSGTFGLERFVSLATSKRNKSIEVATHDLIASVKQFAGEVPLADDLSIIAFEAL